MLSRLSVVSLAVIALASLIGCGGDGSLTTGALDPSRSGSGSVSLSGTVVGMGGGQATSVRAFSSAADPVVVTVQEDPRITTTVAADGTFTLRGLPTGEFSLVFTRGSVVLGSLAFPGVLPNQEITITVDVSGGHVVLLAEQRRGIGHGDIEIEGMVQEVVALNPSGDSEFLIDGYTVIARPGVTAVREGGAPRTVEDVTVGRQVHVKGVWEEIDGRQAVLAHEILLQGPAGDGDPNPGACMITGGIVGRGIQLEGRVATGGSGAFTMTVNRASSPVNVDAAAAEFVCSPRSGPNAPTLEECKAKVSPGAQVHVSGTLTSCSASSALVTADQVKPQK